MLLYHTGYQEIRNPDVHYGRKNADFGQGFYTTDYVEFARRWAKERRGFDIVLNTYALETEGLRVYRLERTAEWFEYIYGNRRGRADRLPEADVIIGPIANDTIYDTMGIITSGFLDKKLALKILQLGPEYRQIVLKTEKAAGQLAWISSEVLQPEEIREYRTVLAEEEERFQRAVSALVSDK